ncbi:hypothetical protein [Rubricoccus marinus]|uniref:Lipoprotein n=1 Tax=Rubricoccus marinus TaxID=716817 RepID=A0A259TX12_9BACT|nr:hypothetical protein [Rubricoccus marinus]OZC02312.1 hypothetical protein BSZ36_04565 [Rubricoccus marinus]
MRFLALCALLPLLLIGCDSSGPESGIGDLTLTLNPTGVPYNSLLLQTEEEYGTNCGLDVDINGDSESIQIEVLGPALADNRCAAVVSPYTIIIPLPSSGLEGYRLDIEKDGDVDSYLVSRLGDEEPLVLTGSGSFSRVLPNE